ncbi:restriction endonuclease [Pseudodesulfovibrio sediminis]|uniref:Restriction endonuclease n=1 Tax=Pseudodesulfovibrio sediminis TaxID=2810563 RepID=A0ABN6EVD6_9BACT|nr:restriction endonuclease [Pseudodesulfovibrio sediminis]BCS89463.1 restriction endonuclease [Pseudodesulfovibrio sediminis]
MTLPTFHEHMLPTLETLSDGQEKSLNEIRETVADMLDISPEDRSDMVPSGKCPRYVDRVNWSVAYFKQAMLVEAVRRGVYKITNRGRDLLGTNPSQIDRQLLMQYPEFVKFITPNNSKTSSDTQTSASAADDTPSTPQELIDDGYQKIVDELADTILSTVKNCSPEFFERLVVDLLLAMGYGGSRQEAGTVTRQGSDEGIDGIINEDRLGLDVIYVQAKRWEGAVSRPEIQKFAGALQGQRAKKGIFITTSTFSNAAYDFTKSIDSKIILIDGIRLSKLMIEHNVGVSTSDTYVIKRIDSDYFHDL